jgi:hypothetical protein
MARQAEAKFKECNDALELLVDPGQNVFEARPPPYDVMIAIPLIPPRMSSDQYLQNNDAISC